MENIKEIELQLEAPLRAASEIGQKGNLKGPFFLKGTKNFTNRYSILFLSVLHQNKALENFHKRGKCPMAGHIKDLD